MEPMEFWKLVEIHRWIPRILISFHERIDVFKHDPTLIALYLRPSAIRNDIAGIEFYPWENLDLNEMPSSVSHKKDNGEDGSSNESHKAVFHQCFYHGSDSGCLFPFSGMMHNMHEPGHSVGHVVRAVLKAGNIPDALVRVRERHEGRFADPRKVIHQILHNQLADAEPFSYSHRYEIFLPPPTLSPADLRR